MTDLNIKIKQLQKENVEEFERLRELEMSDDNIKEFIKLWTSIAYRTGYVDHLEGGDK